MVSKFGRGTFLAVWYLKISPSIEFIQMAPKNLSVYLMLTSLCPLCITFRPYMLDYWACVYMFPQY